MPLDQQIMEEAEIRGHFCGRVMAFAPPVYQVGIHPDGACAFDTLGFVVKEETRTSLHAEPLQHGCLGSRGRFGRTNHRGRAGHVDPLG